MILYHGSYVIVDKPRIIKMELGRDFGFGFYTTDVKEQAVRWARREAKLSIRKGNPYSLYITIYEWLEMICACRSDISFSHGYDMVTGKVANINVGETVIYVVQGIMRKEDAVERLKFEKINNHTCFNTERALEYLCYVGFEECR